MTSNALILVRVLRLRRLWAISLWRPFAIRAPIIKFLLNPKIFRPARYTHGRFYKFRVLSQTRREQKIATTHMIDMLGVIFCEQRSMATKSGFIEVPFTVRPN
jgi:hypothetical protein